MIKSLFPNNILIKDYDLSDEWNSTVTAMAKMVFADDMTKKNDYNETGNYPIDLFTEENFKSCPELLQLQEMFIDGFYELACSYTNTKVGPLTKQLIAENVRKDLGKLPFMKKGDFKSIHTHDKTEAYAVFYLTDIDNKKDGGNLILHDPAFHNAINFSGNRTYDVETKKHRLVVCPNRIWHEVKQYMGDEERISIVMNLAYLDNYI
jgi:hypothetical protein